MRRFALAMGWVVAGILEFERHRLDGLLVWHSARLLDDVHRLPARPAA